MTLLNFIKKIETIVGCLLLAAIIILLFTEIMARACLNKSIVWAIEISETFFVWLVFCGASILVKEKRHLAIAFFTDMLPLKYRIFASIFIDTLIIISMIFVIYSSIKQIAVQSGMLMTTIDLPVYLISLPVLIFSISMLHSSCIAVYYSFKHVAKVGW